jgi:DHA2 family multidrug resistance protein
MRFLTAFSLRAHNQEDSYRLRWWITLAVMLVSIMEMLDLTVVVVSLPHMMGSLEASMDEIVWVLTSYAVATAIMMPLTGVLVARFGCRRLLLTCIVGFMLSSFCCGFSTNLGMIVFFRIAQGLFGASTLPVAQMVIYQVFPQKERGLAMALWGMGIVCAPMLGPVLGGFITEWLTWRWVFYINLPICLVAYALTWALIRETPTCRQKVDGIGLCLMVIGVGALQLLIDRGNAQNWYDSPVITSLTFIAITALLGFVWRCNCISFPLINLRLFKDRNFSLYMLLSCGFSALIIGQIVQGPLMLQTVYGYPIATSGLLMGPRGIGSMLTMVVLGLFIHRLNAQYLMVIGVVIGSISTYMLSQLSLNFNVMDYIWISSLQGVSMSFFLLPVGVFSMDSLALEDQMEAAGLLCFGRNLGMSIGVSLLMTLFIHSQQSNWHDLASHINLFNPNVQAWLQQQDPAMTVVKVLANMAKTLYVQVDILSFNTVSLWAACGLLVLLPLIFLLKKN